MNSARLAVAPAAALVLLSTASVRPATIHVPADQPTIAAGLAAAAAGDEVVVACGSYAEQHLVVPSGVTLRSATGAPDCVHLTSALLGYHLVRLDSVSDVLVQGISFRSRRARGVVVLNSSAIRIENCEFRECENRTGGLLDVEDSEVTAAECHFENNILRRWGGSSQVRAGGTVTLVDCSFAFTAAPLGYPNAAVAFAGPGPHELKQSTFDDIWGTCVIASGCDVVVEDTRFRKGRNTPPEVGPMVALTDGGTLLFRNCVAESVGWAFEYGDKCFEALTGGTLRFESCTLVDSRAFTAIVGSTNAQVEVARSIFTGSDAPAVLHSTGGSLTLTCANVYASSGPVFAGSTPPDTQGVFSADPRFCDPALGDYRLAANSPCRPGATPCGELVGALDVGCGPIAVESTSWGKIKNLYR